MFLSFLPSGGITSAQGFKAWGEHVGLKKFKKDMALIVSEVPAVFAGVFTTNKAKAAPVLWNEAILAQGNSVQAILVNSGQANSCTGPQGVLNASLMAEKAAEALGCATSAVLLASTGIIGTQIKMPEALHGIAKVAANLRADAFAANAAAEAIVTTDSYTKQCTVAFEVNGVKVTLGAMAKGSGMIHPNMATMLSFIATDIAITPALLRKALKASVDKTYNMISVDGDTSTNDMVLMLANGLAGNVVIEEENEHFAAFCSALDQINTFLAKKIVCDAQGVTKRIAVQVSGADSLEVARTVARKVASSNLVKASMHKEDQNWGRVMAAIGSTGVEMDINATSIEFNMQPVEVQISIDFRRGNFTATAWGCDMEYDSIRTSSSKVDMAKILAEVG